MSFYNPEYKVIFIHIPKTAGRSIAAGLNVDRTLTGKSHHRDIHYFKQQLSTKEFDDAFKFAFVRNPLDRFLSASAQAVGDDKTSFEDLVINIGKEENKTGFFKPQNEMIYDFGDNLLIDFVGKFENLQADWDYVRTQLGFGDDLQQLGVGNYTDHYTTQTRTAVTNFYQKDMEVFGYG